MRIPKNQTIPIFFMGNYFCLLPSHEAAFVGIAKNGVTFLKKLAIYFRTGQIIENDYDIHNIVGYHEQSEYLVPVSQMSEYEKEHNRLLKFAVWRDPAERLVSIYKYFCLERTFRHYYNYLALYHNPSFDYFMKFVEFELEKKTPELQDEHIRKQVDYYKESDVDYIVPINKLNRFLEKNGISLIEEKTNYTSVKFELPSKWEHKIKELYKEDYAIKTNF